MIVIDRLANGDLLVEPGKKETQSKLREGLVIHGYGGNKEEMLGLSVNLVKALDLRLLLFDLPGHAPDTTDLLTLENAGAAVTERLGSLESGSFFIGHSLGGRLGLMTGLPQAILLSVPGRALFDGNRRELLSTLRARRVRENSTYEGLREVLAVDVSPATRTLLLYAKNDIKSSHEMALEWKDGVNAIEKIPDCNHLDIISHRTTERAIVSWLRRQPV